MNVLKKWHLCFHCEIGRGTILKVNNILKAQGFGGFVPCAFFLWGEAFLDIELGKTSGFDLCRTLLEINPRTNVVYLTSYIGYAFDAWSTGACGFMRKPLTLEGVKEQLSQLRYPFWVGDRKQ